MSLNEEQRALLWLSLGGVTSSQLASIEQRFKTAAGFRRAYQNGEHSPFGGTVGEVLTSLKSEDALDKKIEYLKQRKIKFFFRDDPCYPELLSTIPDAPYLLYYAGNLDALKMNCIGIVGTRRCSEYGLEMSGYLASGLAKKNICIVSGLAYGIDGAAHKAALNVGGTTIGILGSGINVPYPEDHIDLLRKIATNKGLILSEYPPDSKPDGFHFPYRNRIISGLSLGVVFVEGTMRSGALHTVNAALDQGREVFAVPGQVGKSVAEGPNTILREGARLVTSAKDILEDLGLSQEDEEPEESEEEDINEGLTESQLQIMDALSLNPMTSDEIAKQLPISNDEIIAELGFLEISGLITKEAGNQYRVKISRGRQ